MRRVLLALLAPLALLALGVLVPRPILGAVGQGGSARVLVVAGPIHTDIALPLDARTRERFGFLADAGVPVGDPAARWLLVGWGGRSFYLETPTWADLRPGPVLRALTLDASVMRVDVAGPIAVPQDGVLAVDLAPDARERMEDAILATFARGPDGAPQPIPGAGYGPTDAFFEANGPFNLFLGCNAWTAEMLREGGVTTGLWTPLPRTLFWALRLHGAAAQQRPRRRRRPLAARAARV